MSGLKSIYSKTWLDFTFPVTTVWLYDSAHFSSFLDLIVEMKQKTDEFIKSKQNRSVVRTGQRVTDSSAFI